MNPFDILIVVTLSFCLIRGIFRGLIKEISSVIGVLGGGYAAYTYYPEAELIISRWISDPTYLSLLGFLLIFCSIFVVISVIGIVIKHLLSVSHMGWLDHVFGACFGFIKGLLITVVLLIAFVTFLPKNSFIIEDSKLSPYLNKIAEKTSLVISNDIKKKFFLNITNIKKTWENRR